jgi:hypothetical protein
METQVRATMNRWFDDTFALAKDKAKPWRQRDALLVGVFQCGREYCDGILVLLMNDHKIPAAALLRVLHELCVKLLWCLHAPDKGDRPGTDNCYERFRGWDYQRLIAHKKMLKRLSSTCCGSRKLSIDRTLEQLDDDIKRYESEHVRCMPDVARICEELSGMLPGTWMNAYPEIYQFLSRAVHIDMGLVRQMVQVSGKEVLCFPDTLQYDKPELLHCCVSMGCDINLMLRRHYGCDPGQMQQEHDLLVQRIVEIKKDGL